MAKKTIPFKDRKLVNAAEAAEYIGLSRTSIIELIKDKKIKGRKFALRSKVGNGRGRWLISRETLEQWIEEFMDEAA